MIPLLRAVASQCILPRFEHVQATIKEVYENFREIVTTADLEANELLMPRVRARYPGSYSEESLFSDRFEHDLIWQIDPLDGTQEFVAGMADGYALHAALLKRGDDRQHKSVAGIIYCPGTDKLMFSDASGSVHLQAGEQEQDINVCTRDKLRGYVRRCDPNEQVEQFYGTLAQALGVPLEMNYGGGAGSAMIALLENKINLIVFNYDYSKEWDVAMAEPMLQGKGGFICDLAGENFSYNRQDPFNRNGFVASVAFAKEEIMPVIPKDLLVHRL